MYERPPVDVADVPTTASANESHGHDGTFLFVQIDVLATDERFAVDQHARASCGSFICRRDILSNKPLGELPGVDPCLGERGIFLIGRGSEELQGREFQQSLNL